MMASDHSLLNAHRGGSPQGATAAVIKHLACLEGSATLPSTQALQAVDTGQQAPAARTWVPTGLGWIMPALLYS